MAQRVGQTAHESGPSPKDVVAFWSKDYLGLAHHPAVVRAVQEALADEGVGSGAARAEAAGTDRFQELEHRLAAFRQVEAVLTFQTGFMTNLGVFTTIAGRADLVVFDELSHPSIGDAVLLSGAQARTYAHKDVDALDAILKSCRAESGRKHGAIVVATDTVFGMEGEIAPLPQLVASAARYEATVVLDDAHGFGVLGRGGRGAIDHFGLHGRVDIEVATLSKALGVMGGFAGGRATLKARLEQDGRPILYSTSPPPALAVGAIAALDVLEREPERVERLWENAGYLREGLRDLGYDTGGSETPIIPVLMADARRTTALWQGLRDDGIDTQRVIGHRVTPRLRLIVSSEHTLDQLNHCVQAMKDVGTRIGVI